MQVKEKLGCNLGLLMFSFLLLSLQMFGEYEKLSLICKTVFEVIMDFRIIKE